MVLFRRIYMNDGGCAVSFGCVIAWMLMPCSIRVPYGGHRIKLKRHGRCCCWNYFTTRAHKPRITGLRIHLFLFNSNATSFTRLYIISKTKMLKIHR